MIIESVIGGTLMNKDIEYAYALIEEIKKKPLPMGKQTCS